MYAKALKNNQKVFSVAPMMDWTDRHCRFLHRQLSKHALLYTEMVVAEAVIRGEKERLIGFDPCEHPVALQLGGSDPARLVLAAKICADYGYDEINLNVGCPSDRVQSGTFGAVLMRSPDLVAECVAAMKAVVDIPVTVKCRLGVDDQEPEDALYTMAEKTFAAGSDALWVHARKAWLQGLSPKENRDVPPLDYEIVYRLKQKYSNKFIGLNGGLESVTQSLEILKQLDGAMFGRAAYHNSGLLTDVDHLIYGEAKSEVDWDAVAQSMMDHTSAHIAKGGRLIHVARHMVGLFHGLRGARKFRQILSNDAVHRGNDVSVIREAFAAIEWDYVPEVSTEHRAKAVSDNT